MPCNNNKNKDFFILPETGFLGSIWSLFKSNGNFNYYWNQLFSKPLWYNSIFVIRQDFH